MKPKRVRARAISWMDRTRPAREGETAFSPERTLGLAPVAAKEGVRGGTMGSPTLNFCRCTGYDAIVDSVRAAAGIA